jgi:hypothetical protein
MRVLVGCEYSGIVRDAFLKRGHYALSCDILPTESELQPPDADHWQGDIFSCLRETDDWDLIILHPPCTYLSLSGNRWYGTGMPSHYKRLEAIEWTVDLWEAAKQKCVHVVLENPTSVIFNHLSGGYLQYWQPHQFGVKEFKKTGFIRTAAVPELQPQGAITPPEPGTDEYREWQRVWNMPPGPDRGKLRSRFFEPVADAMAEQWSW